MPRREAGFPVSSVRPKLLESLGQLAQLLLECPDAITELLAQSDQRLTLFQATVVPVEKPRRRTMEKRGEPREMSVGDDGSCLVALKERAVTPRLAASSAESALVPANLCDPSTHDGGGSRVDLLQS